MKIIEQLRERLGFHWQNLSDAPGQERHGFWHGRAWFGITGNRGPRAMVSWHHGRNALAGEIQFDREQHRLMAHIAIPGASYWIAVEGLPAAWFERLPFNMNRTEYQFMGSPRSIGFRVHGGALWLSFWEDLHEWRAKDPWWWRARLGLDDIADLLFGKEQYAKRVLEERDVEIPMHEGTHAAKAKLELAMWIRPRWPWAPFSKRRIGVNIDIPDGIETDHKGPLYGISTPAKTIAEGIGAVVASVVRSRGRYTTERAS